MLPPEYYEYYDKLQLHKNYGAEVDAILRIFSDYTGRLPDCVLDIGCGTGNHAFNFAARGIRVVGMDIDSKIVEVAKRKQGTEGDNPLFVDMMTDVHGIFDLVIALFNVVNYVEDRKALLEFFENIRNHLGYDGLLIFDCWNGIAAIRDLPRRKTKRIADLEIEIGPCIDLMHQKVVMRNSVRGPDCDFVFSYVHRLWTPQDFIDILKYVGFEFIRTVAWMRPTVLANHGSWKMMFICHRRLPHGD